MDSREYWNANLDTDNLSRRGGAEHGDLDEPLAFASTPELLWLRERLGDVEGRLIVDLGGGVGMHALYWARLGARVVVADLALERLRRLRELARKAGLAEQIHFVAAAAEALPFGSVSVDVVFTKSVLIHTDLPRAASEVHRVLVDGGRGTFIEPLGRNPLMRFYRRWFAPRIWRSITRYFDEEGIAALGCPFAELRWEPFYLLSAGSFFWQYGRKNLGRFRASLRRWQRVDAWLLERWPALRVWCWFVSIEVRKQAAFEEAGAGFLRALEASGEKRDEKVLDSSRRTR